MHYAIGVGSNRGDRAATIALAAERLQADGLVTIVARSRLVENPAVGGPPGQGDFLNGVWLAQTALGPHQLLGRLLIVEAGLGRCRTVHWGPRTLDLDLLLAEDGRVLVSERLVLPHPRLHERPFVLQPLAEVAPEWRHPSLGLPIAALRDRLEDRG